MAEPFIFLTGDKELDDQLRLFSDKLVKDAVRKATRETVKNHVLPEYRNRIVAAGFIETGATLDAAKTRAVKRSREQFGHELHVDRVQVVETRRERGGRIGYDKKRKEDFFHPVAIEFGVATQEPERPLFRALMDSTQQAIALFRWYLRQAVIALATGRKFRR